MDQQQIKVFIDAFRGSDLTEMEFSRDGWTLRLARGTTPASYSSARQKTAGPEPETLDRPAVRASTSAPLGNELLAPLHGVVHLRNATGEPLLVQVGQAVSAGQTVCVIEAMKVFNEVRVERDGVIAHVLVASGDEVEAGQLLLRFA